MTNSSGITISVVVPTYNRLDRLKHVLAALEAQTYPSDQFEVIVVSDGSVDGTDEYLAAARTSLQLLPVRQSNAGPAVARNTGISRASGTYVLFIDDDVVPTPNLIAEHLSSHQESPHDVVVLGPMLSPDDFVMLPWVRWEQAMLAKQYAAMQRGDWEPTARQFYTGNASLLRRYLVASGGFDSTFRRAEDVELAYRLAADGLKFVFNPQAVGYHYAERSFHSWMEIPYTYGRNDIIFTRDKHYEWLLPTITSEFQQRNRLIQTLVRLCVGRCTLTTAMFAWLRSLAWLGQRLQLERVVHFTHSGMFNLRYYQGIADELGGRELFFAGVSHVSTHYCRRSALDQNGTDRIS